MTVIYRMRATAVPRATTVFSASLNLGDCFRAMNRTGPRAGPKTPLQTFNGITAPTRRSGYSGNREQRSFLTLGLAGPSASAQKSAGQPEIAGLLRHSLQHDRIALVPSNDSVKFLQFVRLRDRHAQFFDLESAAVVDRISSVSNLNLTDRPFGFQYSFEAQNYAKNAGGLLLVRPRVLGIKASGILETKEPRNFDIELEGPSLDTDTFDITIPAGYVVDDVPPAVDADYDLASYHAKTEVKGNLIHYSRRFEIKELSVPVAKADELKKFYRIIAGDERNTVVLKAVAQ